MQPQIQMTRSVHIVTDTVRTEQPTLFDIGAPPTHYYIRHSLQFEFWEHDTLVHKKAFYLDTHPRDWHFKARLLTVIKQEITQNHEFIFTKWNKREDFKYSYVLKDNAGILKWVNQKGLMALFDVA